MRGPAQNKDDDFGDVLRTKWGEPFINLLCACGIAFEAHLAELRLDQAWMNGANFDAFAVEDRFSRLAHLVCIPLATVLFHKALKHRQ